MTTAIDTNEQTDEVVTAKKVDDEQRLEFLPKFFGEPRMMRGEQLVYSWMECLTKDYSGGYWEFYTLSNGGFYLAPSGKSHYQFEIDTNGFSGLLSSDAAGIVATLFAIGHLCEDPNTPNLEALIDHYHELREFIYVHPENGLILSAID